MQRFTVSLKIQNVLSPLVFIGIAVILRLLPHVPNVAPIGAMALFGGVYINKKYALLVPLIAMFISDIFLGFTASMPLIYTSFFIIGCIGLWLRKHKEFKNILFCSIASSLIFFLLTNFNFWVAESLYPKTFAGLLQSYTMALPFFRNTIMGDLLYTGVFFGSYECISFLVKKQKIHFNLL